MLSTFIHDSLGATLHGLDLGRVWQFRGLQYANIPYRFADPEAPAAISGDVDCTQHGPRCPQNYVDFRYMLRIPRDLEVPKQCEDEFACANLDVTMPAPSAASPSARRLPVFVWIHGGSQTVSFGNSASKLCDPANLVEASVAMDKPMIAVTLNYRLNLFAFGDHSSSPNLALRDQRRALEYVQRHIAGFGGDPTNITIAGESAGGVFCHAHIVTGAPVRQCVMQSGTLHLSPPRPRATAESLMQSVSGALSRLGNWTLRDAPVAKLLQAQADVGVVSVYLQMEEQLNGWEERLGSAQRLLIGNNEYESVLYRSGIEQMSAPSIVDAFDLSGDSSAQLRRIYGVYPDNPIASRLGAQDLLNDLRFNLPVDTMVEQWKHAQRPVFRCLVDQPNPWQTSSRAHHAVDLLYLFAGFDLSFAPEAQQVSHSMQQKWIEFIAGECPWQPGKCWAFGPCGESKEIDLGGLEARRRQRHLVTLRAAGLDKINAVARSLEVGRISLLN